jgi:hypothetical protein
MNPQRFIKATGGFSPSDLSNLYLWFDFSDTSTMTLDSSSITSITDKIQGYTVSQGTASNQPTLTTLGGVNVGSFDYVNDLLINTSSNPFDGTETNLDFIALVHYPSNPTGNTVVWGLGDTSGDGAGNAVACYQFNSTDRISGSRGDSRMIQRRNSGNPDRIQGSTTNATSAGDTHLLHVVVDDGNPWALFTDGVSQSITIYQGSNSGDTPGDWMAETNDHAFCIGTAETTGTIAHMGGYILQLFCFEGTNLDAAGKDKLTDWINNLYGTSFSY